MRDAYILTVDTVTVVVWFMMLRADPTSLSGKDLEDKCFHNERYYNFKYYQVHDVEGEEVQSHKPVSFYF